MKYFLRGGILFVSLIFLPGCGWLNSKQAVVPPDVQFLKVGKVIDAKRLRQGGKLLIVSFSAGAGVEATDQLDRVALMIVKGLADILKENSSPFEILDSNNAREAEIVMSGHVTAFSAKADSNLLFLNGMKIYCLAVEGKIIDPASGEKILIFSDSKESRQKDEEAKDLGYRMGRDIGSFILSSMQ